MEATNEIETNVSNPCLSNETADENQSFLQPANEGHSVMSKRQLKLLEKRKRWLELKPLRKAKEKEKRKLKMQMAKESGIALRPSRKMLKASEMSNSSCKLRVCFDLSLGHLMTSSELSKTFKQLQRCYSINRKASAPLQVYITGYNEEIKCAMNKLSGCFNWDIYFDDKVYHELFDPSDVVYLTSDSPNVLESFDDTKVYIIGALVDHNRLKNICFEKALKEGVGHARLPLDKYFKFKSRTVLTIDQVYSIILQITEGKSWIDAVSDIVPKRKGIELIGDLESDGDNIKLDEISVLSSDVNENNITHSTDVSFVDQDDEDRHNNKCDITLNLDPNSNNNSVIDNSSENRTSTKHQ